MSETGFQGLDYGAADSGRGTACYGYDDHFGLIIRKVWYDGVKSSKIMLS
jgi:hypothetical protein